MTKPQAIKLFTDYNRPFNDYWSMQLAWTVFVDGLERNGEITMKQQANCIGSCKDSKEFFVSSVHRCSF